MSRKSQWSDVNVLCPYYIHKTKVLIACEVDKKRRFEFRGYHNDDATAVDRQYEHFCCAQWEKCPLAVGLNKVLED